VSGSSRGAEYIKAEVSKPAPRGVAVFRRWIKPV